MSNILSSGPVQLPIDPTKMSTKELLNGGRTVPKSTPTPSVTPAVGVNGTRMANPGIWGRVRSAGGTALNGLVRITGAATALNPNASPAARVEGGASMLFPKLAIPLAAGSFIGNWMKDNLPESDFVSGRGAGRSALSGKDQRNKDLKAIEGTLAPVREAVNTESLREEPEQTAPVAPEVTAPASSPAPAADPGPAAPSDMSEADKAMFQWAQNFQGLAKKVKPGQAGYDVIQKALGKDTAQNPYSINGDFKLEGVDVGDLYKPAIDLKGKIESDPNFTASYKDAPQEFLSDKISLLTTSASSLQQPNFDGSDTAIGGSTPKSPQPVQEFENANTNPAEVVPTTYHPLNKAPSAEAEAANAEYGAMKFEYDPVKNMMVRVK